MQLEIYGQAVVQPQNPFPALDAKVIEQTKKDLRFSCHLPYVLTAAKYFFTTGTDDENDPLTFATLCARNGIDAEAAAQAIWNKLGAKRQKFITRLFREAGYITAGP